MDDMLAEQFTGLKSGKKKSGHRGFGSRSRGKGPKVPTPAAHAEAKTHLANAQAATDPADTHKHLWKALTAMKKC